MKIVSSDVMQVLSGNAGSASAVRGSSPTGRAHDFLQDSPDTCPTMPVKLWRQLSARS